MGVEGGGGENILVEETVFSKELGEKWNLMHLKNQKMTIVAGAVKSQGSRKQVGEQWCEVTLEGRLVADHLAVSSILIYPMSNGKPTKVKIMR